jgi:hypothetical protein
VTPHALRVAQVREEVAGLPARSGEGEIRCTPPRFHRDVEAGVTARAAQLGGEPRSCLVAGVGGSDARDDQQDERQQSSGGQARSAGGTDAVS